MTILRTITTTALLLVLSGVAHVAPTNAARDKLFSPMLFINDGTLTQCSMVNASKTAISVEIQIFRAAFIADVTDFTSCENPEAPGGSCSALYTNETGGGEAVYCVITTEENPKKIRGSFAIRETCDATCETSVAVDVR